MLTGTTHRSIILIILEMSSKRTLMIILLYEQVLSNMLPLGCYLICFTSVNHLSNQIVTVINSFTVYEQYFI